MNHRALARLALGLAIALGVTACTGSGGRETNAESLGDETGTDGGEDGAEDGGEDIEPPPQPLHRLNAVEYDNTVADLLGTTLRPGGSFPPDPKDNGFDNQFESLTLGPALLEQYYSAAGAVLNDALTPKPVLDLSLSRDDIGFGEGSPGAPISGEWLQMKSAPLVAAFEVLPAEAGAASLSFLGGRVLNGISPEPTMEVRVDGEVVGSTTVQGSTVAPQRYEVQLVLAEGPHTVEYVPLNYESDAVAGNANNILFLALDIESDAIEDGPGHTLLLVCDPHSGLDCVEEVLERFAARAWRRPPTLDEVQSLVDLFITLRAGGESVDEALKLVVRGMLTSPKFLYRMRTSADLDTTESLDGFVLASRLSYFLWSSMPDQALFDAAASGELQTVEGLLAQAQRMLAHPKAQALVDNFGEQWLSVRAAQAASPDPEFFPDFGPATVVGLEEESRLLFADFLHSSQPAAELLAPGFAYTSPRLDAHYLGLLPPNDPQVDTFTRVEGAERAGLLSLGAWLAATSDPIFPSPIRRGHWVSEHVMCAPVQPPPPGLEIPELPLPNDEQTIREQLEAHRSDPVCAGCHNFLDVLGMGLQRYDSVARVRDEPELDTYGELPGGIGFEGAEELAAALVPEEFLGCVGEKLFTYGVGRRPDTRERDELDAQALQAVAEGAPLEALVLAVVMSPSFRGPGRWEEDE